MSGEKTLRARAERRRWLAGCTASALLILSSALLGLDPIDDTSGSGAPSPLDDAVTLVIGGTHDW